MAQAPLAQELADAEVRVALIKRRIEFATCAEAGHDWKQFGGKNAGCDDVCRCSVPVLVCSRCEDCDYGDNDEATEIRAKCAEKRECP